MKDYEFITVDELTKRFYDMGFDDTISFTFDLDDYGDDAFEPTGWYGFKKLDLFDEPAGIIVMGYYGGCDTVARVPIFGTLEETREIIQTMLNDEAGYKVEKVCVSTKEALS